MLWSCLCEPLPLRLHVSIQCVCDRKLLHAIADCASACAAVRVGQVTSCAASWNGGPIYDPCTGSSGPGYYANRRMAQ